MDRNRTKEDDKYLYLDGVLEMLLVANCNGGDKCSQLQLEKNNFFTKSKTELYDPIQKNLKSITLNSINTHNSDATNVLISS